MNLKGKKLLVLTGSNGSNDIIHYAKNKGVFTIATDYHTVSTVKDMADCRYDVSTTDVESLYSIAKKHGVDGITTGTSETSMYSILELTERLGLPFYATACQLENINNKIMFKNLLKQNSIPVIKDYKFTEEELENIEYPVIIKPADSSGAKGINICRDEQELKYYSKNALKYSRNKQVVVEKYLTGLPETFINYTIVDGVFSLSCSFDIYRNYHYEVEGMIGLPIAYLFPSKYLQLFINTIAPKIISAFKSINIKNGAMSIQCFVDDRTFYIYEAGYRLGGGQSYIFTNKLNGINTMGMMVNYALTGKMSQDKKILEKDDPYFKNPCLQYNIPLKPGRITVFEGVQEVKKMNNVLNVTEVHRKGDIVKKDGSVRNHICLRIHIYAESALEMSSIIKRINNTLVIEDEYGNDMILERYSH